MSHQFMQHNIGGKGQHWLRAIQTYVGKQNSINMMICTMRGVFHPMYCIKKGNFSGIADRKVPKIASDDLHNVRGFPREILPKKGNFSGIAARKAPRIASGTPLAGILMIVCNAHLDWEVYAGSNMQNIGAVAHGWLIRNIDLRLHNALVT